MEMGSYRKKTLKCHIKVYQRFFRPKDFEEYRKSVMKMLSYIDASLITGPVHFQGVFSILIGRRK